MNLILDMNISPKLVDLLSQNDINSKHWCTIGKPDARDSEIMEYAKQNDCVIVTCDLDFTTILSNTKENKPSVIQIRKQGLQSDMLAKLLAIVLSQWKSELEKGAVLIIDAKKVRVRILPLDGLDRA